MNKELFVKTVQFNFIHNASIQVKKCKEFKNS